MSEPDGLPPLDVGDLNIAVRGQQLHIEQADARVWASDELLSELRSGSHRAVTISGDLLTITGDDRTVVYRITDQARPGWRLLTREDIPDV